MNVQFVAFFVVTTTSLFHISAAEYPACPAPQGGECLEPKLQDSRSTKISNPNDDDSCSLYLAPSVIPGAGLGIYTAVDVPVGSAVGELDELFIPIIDHYKTLPYRGQHKFLSWLGYVWPDHPFAFNHMYNDSPFPAIPNSYTHVKQGLNSAMGLKFQIGQQEPMSVFAPGIASLANSDLKQSNIVKVDEQRKDWTGLHFGRDAGVGAFSPYHGVAFTASRDIPAGSELLINYGSEWHARFEWRNRTKNEKYLTLEDYRNKRLKEVNLPTEAMLRNEHEVDKQEHENLRMKVQARMKRREKFAAHKEWEVQRELEEEEEEEKEVRQRVEVVFRQVDGTLDMSKMAAIDVYESDGVETAIELLHRLEIPRMFWDIPRVKLDGSAVTWDSLESGDEIVFEPIEDHESLGDMTVETGYILVVVADDTDDEEEPADANTSKVSKKETVPTERSFATSVDWLAENGFCIDNIIIGQSTVPQAGRGSFAKRRIPEGSPIAPAPLLALKRDDLIIYEADSKASKFRNVLKVDEPVGQELLLNYCYGHPDSPLLLLPYSPVVCSINHNSHSPNAAIRWPERPVFGDPKNWLRLHPLDVLEMSGDLMMEVVALRDIKPGEEIFIDYGREWEDAWTKYENEQELEAQSGSFVYGTFRHEIGVPDGFFPDAWKNKSVVYEPAALTTPLKPGEIVPVAWAHNGQPVSKAAWMVGLPQGFSNHVLQYANDAGIVKMYESLLDDDLLESNEWFVFNTQGEQWFAQRYDSKTWNLNIHYIAAWDEAARVSFLRALGTGGYDTVLASVGNHFGYENITCFHASFMGVSECDKSVTHADLYATGEKGLNIIFPIITVNGSKPELDIQSDNANIVTSVKYQTDVAYVMSDYGYHKTSQIEYSKGQGENRVVVGMYCAQIDESNAEMMKYIYDGERPAPFLDQFNLPLKEAHWGNGRSLPK